MPRTSFVTVTMAAALSLTTTPVVAQSLLGNLLKRLAPSGPTGASSSGIVTQPIVQAFPSAAQTAAVDRLIHQRQQNPLIAQDVQGAGPLIAKLVTTGTCGSDDRAWNAFNRVSMDPGTRSDSRQMIARGYSQYHDPRYCYDVTAIVSYEKPAANALKFTANYVSPQSQEATHQVFVLIKSPEGDWMVKSISPTNGFL